jgi:hypothetical protein
MEKGLVMLSHSVLIEVLLYFCMIYLGHGPLIAENRSILFASLALVYMILFGHGAPTSINKGLYN